MHWTWTGLRISIVLSIKRTSESIEYRKSRFLRQKIHIFGSLGAPDSLLPLFWNNLSEKNHLKKGHSWGQNNRSNKKTQILIDLDRTEKNVSLMGGYYLPELILPPRQIRYALKKKKRYYLGIFPKRRTPTPTPPFWEPLIQKNF